MYILFIYYAFDIYHAQQDISQITIVLFCGLYSVIMV